MWLLLGLLLLAAPQKERDPLSSGQADQVRELGDRPVERVKLFLKFVNERAAAIKDLTPNSTENNRPAELRARYEEFTRLVDELAENIDTYHEDKADLRKALRPVLDASAKWPDILKAPVPNGGYDFARTTALDAAASLTEDVRKSLADEEAYFLAHKKEANGNGKAPSPDE